MWLGINSFCSISRDFDLFEESVQSLASLRDRLLENLDLIMYQPVLLFGADNELRNTLIAYVEAWGATLSCI